MKDFTPAQGMYPVLVTPFNEDLSIDWFAYEQLIDWHVARGVTGLFAVCGSSEYFELTQGEALRLATVAVERAAGKVHVLAGSSIHATVEQNIELTQRMSETGVEGCFITTPPPEVVAPEDGPMLEYYFAIHDAVDFPIWSYEQPVSPYKFSYDAMKQIGAGDHFVGMKDTSVGGMSNEEAAAHMKRKMAAAGDDFRILTASSEHLLPLLEAGVAGGMTIAANAAPSLFAELWRRFKVGDMDAARTLQKRVEKVDEMVGYGYMKSAKIAEALQGVPIKPITRVPNREFNEDQMQVLRDLVTMIQQTEREFDIPISE
jgi:4-hydroxy-tetrahydrodipicolinate synthase